MSCNYVVISNVIHVGEAGFHSMFVGGGWHKVGVL